MVLMNIKRAADGPASGPPELSDMRKRLRDEFKDVFADSLPVRLPPGRGHELHIKLVEGARPPAQVPPRIKPKHEALRLIAVVTSFTVLRDVRKRSEASGNSRTPMRYFSAAAHW